MAQESMQSDSATGVAQSYSRLVDAVAEAAKAAGREAAEITLVAVSKTRSAQHIEPVLSAGHIDFGENRVQEAQAKWPDLKARYPAARLHLIGALQSNKARDAVALADAIHSLDREKLARAISQEMARSGRAPECFIQVNTGEEEQKAGIWPEDADAFIALVRDELGLSVRGLMCIPPVEEECSLHFALLREIAQRNGLEGLSMGMSADYEVAIQFGATLVRVGTAIFGARKPHP